LHATGLAGDRIVDASLLAHVSILSPAPAAFYLPQVFVFIEATWQTRMKGGLLRRPLGLQRPGTAPSVNGGCLAGRRRWAG